MTMAKEFLVQILQLQVQVRDTETEEQQSHKGAAGTHGSKFQCYDYWTMSLVVIGVEGCDLN